jgi:hypothetical protein
MNVIYMDHGTGFISNDTRAVIAGMPHVYPEFTASDDEIHLISYLDWDPLDAQRRMVSGQALFA